MGNASCSMLCRPIDGTSPNPMAIFCSRGTRSCEAVSVFSRSRRRRLSKAVRGWAEADHRPTRGQFQNIQVTDFSASRLGVSAPESVDSYSVEERNAAGGLRTQVGATHISPAEHSDGVQSVAQCEWMARILTRQQTEGFVSSLPENPWFRRRTLNRRLLVRMFRATQSTKSAFRHPLHASCSRHPHVTPCISRLVD